MKLPIFKNLQKSLTVEELEQALLFLEKYAEAPAVKEEDQIVIGEMISNVCGALEMQKLIQSGMSEKEAANSFMKRVLGSIN